MRRYLPALIIILWSGNLAAAVAFSPSDIEWGSPVSGTLYRGNTLTKGEYMVKAVEFPSPVQGLKDISGNIVPETDVDPSAYIEIYKNNVLIKAFVMTPMSEPYTDPDYEVKISATAFIARNAKEWVYEFYKPWVTMSISTRAYPKLDVSVTTDKAAYTSYDDMTVTATVTVKNSGDAFAKNTDVNLYLGELKLRGGDANQLHKYYYRMEKGASNSFEVILVVPELDDQKSYNLSADAKGYDVKEKEYKAAGSALFTVSPKQNYFTISKGVSKDRIYLQESITVRITVANSGMYDAYNISVTDSMAENFELKSNTSFKWYIPVLKSGQEWGAQPYTLKPLETNINGFTIPAATAQFTANNKPYSKSTQTTKVIVNGPKIVLNKTVNKPLVNLSEDVTVTVKINNVGNIATNTEVKDSLPGDVSLVSGSTTLASIYLESNAPKEFSYMIRMNKEGEYKLPPAVANYTNIEYKGAVRAAKSSERPVITVIDPSKITPTPSAAATSNPTKTSIQNTSSPPSPTSTPEPTPTPITPGFDFIFAVIVLVLVFCRRR